MSTNKLLQLTEEAFVDMSEVVALRFRVFKDSTKGASDYRIIFILRANSDRFDVLIPGNEENFNRVKAEVVALWTA